MSATEIFANQPFGTVTSGGTDTTSTTWTVSSNPAAPFPAAATGVSQFHVTDTDPTAASEIILVTNVSGSTWTVVRGAEGTTPVVHEANFTITQVLTAGWLSGVNSGVNPVDSGGTGIVTAAAYALLAGGTTSTSPFQQVSGLGSSGQVLTSQGAGSLPSWMSQTGLVNPMTTHGDMIFENAALAPAALPGNTGSTKNFLTSTGSGGTANSPAWGTIAVADVPVLNQNTTGTAASATTAANVSGTVAVINGGTGLNTLTTYGVLTGGMSSTAALQQVASLGTAGQVLTSQGAGSLPIWQAAPGGTFGTGLAGQTLTYGTSNTITWQYAPVDWINAKTAYGADNSGAGDATTAINNAIGAATSGQSVYLPAGTYLLNGSTYPTITTAGVRLVGDGPKATYIKIGSSFSGSQAVFLNAEGCAVENMSFSAATSTTTSNPAADAIYLNGQRFNRVTGVEFEYINGWCVNEIATSSQAPYATMLTNLSSYENCAGGIHVKSNTSVTWGAQVFLDNINMQQIGVGSGANANLDAFRFEDCFDITASNFNAGVSDAGTGSTINITGNCASHYFTNMDLGCFPNAAGSTNSIITIQAGANGHPSDIRFVQGEAQQGQTGLTVSGATSKVSFTSYRFFNNYGDGARVTGTGADIRFNVCTWDQNGQAASGTIYDLNWSGTATGSVYLSKYSSPVVGSGTIGVQSTVNLASTGQAVPHFLTDFGGAGSTTLNAFTHAPNAIVRTDTSPPSWSGRLNLSSGQTANYGLLVTNTTAAPSVPYTQFAAKNGTEQTLGVAVTGDTQQRLLVDSSGKMLWGAGGTIAGDANLYRVAAGALQTDSSFTVGGTLTAATPLMPGFCPADAGFLEWNYDPVTISAGNTLATVGTVYLMRVNLRVPRTITNVCVFLGGVGTGLTTGENFAGLYSSGGSLIATSADQTTNWTSGGTAGLKTISLSGGPYTGVPAGFVWVALLSNWATTAPTFYRAFNVTAAASNIGFTASTARHAAATGGTILPSSITVASNSLQATEYWAAIS